MAFGAARIEPWTPTYPPVRVVTVSGMFHGSLVSEVSAEDSVLYDRPNPACNKKGVMLDNHIGRGKTCERCGAKKERT